MRALLGMINVRMEQSVEILKQQWSFFCEIENGVFETGL
jgi:hypothetical protein